MADPFLAKIEEWVERSCGKIGADVVFDKLGDMGFEGSDRTVRRAVAEVKADYRRGRRRVYRPWIPGPGMWARGHFPTEQAALKCLYLMIRSLDPTGGGRRRWTMR